MSKLHRLNYSITNYLSEIKSRIVAASGRPSDRYHLGKLILQSLQDAPDFVSQIDGYTGESETAGSVLERSVRCATCFRTLGLGCEDVVVIMALNHLDLCVPFYATQYLGIITAPLDRNLAGRDLEEAFNCIKPKLVFCQGDKCKDVREALLKANLKANVVSFDKCENCVSMREFLDKYENFETIEAFKPTDFDTHDTISMLIGTSGSTGRPKFASHMHVNMASSMPFYMCMFESFPTPTRLNAVFSSFQWISAIAMFVMSPILRYTRLQTSFYNTSSTDHMIEIIHKYQPTYSIVTPPFLNELINSGNNIDLSSYEVFGVGGSAVSQDFVSTIQALSPGTQMRCMYGMTECGIPMLNDDIRHPTSMKPLGITKCRLVDLNSGEDIEEPNVQGELWITGSSVFRGYYNQPKENKYTFSEDGWLKTGDIFYRDENWNYYFVERYKFLLQYFSKEHKTYYMISPVEIENVIRKNPRVREVAVTGMPHREYDEVPVAFVVRRNGCDVTAQDVHDTVKEHLADQKQLRGGVVFVDELPLTPSTKVDRKKLREMAKNQKDKN